MIRGLTKRAFTLIELLVVIGIIAILAGVLTPAIQSIFIKGQKVTAQGDAKRLVSAWKQYFAEYGRWPTIAAENLSTGLQMNGNFVDILTTRYNTNNVNNPRRIKFAEIVAEQLTATTNFVDPWGTPYRILFDTNYNGQVERTGFSPVYDTVIAWSAGPDTNDASVSDVADDIRSW